MFAIILLLLIGGIAWVIYKLEFEQKKRMISYVIFLKN